jgi:hypothetical protein
VLWEALKGEVQQSLLLPQHVGLVRAHL